MPEDTAPSPPEFEEVEEINLSPKWPPRPDLPLKYANHFSVMNTGHEVILTFGEFLPNLSSFRGDEQGLREFAETASIIPVARIALSPAGLEALFNLLSKHVEEAE